MMLVWSVLAVTALGTPRFPESRQYSLTFAGAGGAGEAIGPPGLSDSGFVTGSQAESTGGSAEVGFRWSSDAASEPAPVLVPGPESWAGSSAVDVNDSGVFVGCFGAAEDASFLSRGYRWKDGVTEELLTPLGQRAFPSAINDGGWIVGYAGIQPAGTPGAVLWDPELEPSFVADLSMAVDINAAGQVVGYKKDESGTPRAFLWEKGELVALGGLDPRGVGAVYPKAIDDRGRVVGTSVIRGREHAFLWTREGGMQELFGPGRPRAPYDVAALDVNEWGWVVGYAPTARGRGAVVWTPEGEALELSRLVPELAAGGTLRAHRINARGQIAGTLEDATGKHTVLLTPCERPSSTSKAPAVGMIR